MEELPLVSICMPAYNSGAFIRHALESCINQTYRNIEIIVTDNASTDNTEEIVSSYARRDSRIKYFKNESNIGSGNNYMRACALASGTFAQAIGSDDWLSRNYVEEGVQELLNNVEIGAVIPEILSFALDKSSEKLTFLDDLPISSGVYPVDWLYRGMYLGYAPTGFFSLMRKKDLVDGLKKTLANSEYLLQRGERLEPFDMFFFLEAIQNYKLLLVKKKGAYLKTIHGPEQAGLTGGYLNIEGHTRYANAVRLAQESFFTKHKLANHNRNLRFFSGLSIVANAMPMYFKTMGDERKKYKIAFRSFFIGYSKKEKLFILLLFVPYIIFRLYQRILKKVKKPYIFKPSPIYFISEESKFKS